MRKALIVLLLLVAVIGMAFAGNDETSQPKSTESQTVTLVMRIGEKLPVFNLRASSGSITVSTNAAGKAFPNGGDHSAELVLSDVDISKDSIEQTFEIVSAAMANTTRTFTFTVEATAFTAQIAEGETTPAYTTKGDISYTYKGESTTDIITIDDTQGCISATFKAPQTSSNVKIGQIVVKWPKDPSAIPGEYSSDVTMTVVSD